MTASDSSFVDLFIKRVSVVLQARYWVCLRTTSSITCCGTLYVLRIGMLLFFFCLVFVLPYHTILDCVLSHVFNGTYVLNPGTVVHLLRKKTACIQGWMDKIAYQDRVLENRI